MSILVGPVTLSATGGTISSITGYKVHTFSTPGAATFIPSQNGTIEVLVVGAGGFTGSGAGGGGGGAVVYNKLVNVTAGTPYPITVGAVGASGGLGGSSVCTFNNGTITAFGGGSGGPNSGFSSPNASGGGAGGGVGGAGGTGAGVIGLGFPGGSSPGSGAGGGGGAGGAGVPGPAGTSGYGGIGVPYSITGASSYYGAGAGGFYSSPSLPNGGLSGASFGTGNTPGGVIIRYPV